MAGDALLHLLPHALLPDHGGSLGGVHEENLHRRAVWLGLVAGAAVMGFYFFEKMINVIQAWHSRRKLRVEKTGSGEGEGGGRTPPRIVIEGHEVSDRVRGEPKCIQKYSSYCVDDLKPGEVRKINNNSVAAAEFQQNNNGEKVIISQHEVGDICERERVS